MTPEDEQRVRAIAREEIETAMEAERRRARQIFQSLAPPMTSQDRQQLPDAPQAK